MATNDKYDRQLRLWGANGQRALMNAHILLINADAAGTETLKNLVLPGIGRFTVLDNKEVTEDDLGANFFVTADCLGRPRGDVVTELLCEMNPDVSGFALSSYPQGGFTPEFWSQFTLVIATNLDDKQTTDIAVTCLDYKIPLVVVRSYGLIGSCRLQLSQHNIIESKPESDPFDLRILNPFPELEAYCASFNMTEMESLEHSHTPYVVILYQAIQRWKEAHSGTVPHTFAEKEAFKASIKAMSRDFSMEQNFEEAVKEAYRAFATKMLPDEVLDLLELQAGKILSAESSEFDFLVRALQMFLEAQYHSSNSSRGLGSGFQPLSPGSSPAPVSPREKWTGSPPLSGSVPDMVSTTAFFVGLQQVYQQKAAADRVVFKSMLADVISEATRSSVPHAAVKMTRTTAVEIADETIDIFCKNIFNLRSVTTRTLAEERSEPASETILNALGDPYEDAAQTPIHWYIALRAADRFQLKTARWPGAGDGPEDDSQVSADVEAVWSEMQALMHEYGLPEDSELPSKDHAEEIVRYGGGELHSVSALVGGVAAQEAVKIITHQYVPLNNTFIYNGVAGCAETYEL